MGEGVQELQEFRSCRMGGRIGAWMHSRGPSCVHCDRCYGIGSISTPAFPDRTRLRLDLLLLLPSPDFRILILQLL
jgi:hypothetical protein